MNSFMDYIVIPATIIFIGWLAIRLDWMFRDENYRHEDWKRDLRRIRGE
jgi:hypothetical protein